MFREYSSLNILCIGYGISIWQDVWAMCHVQIVTAYNYCAVININNEIEILETPDDEDE